MLVQLKVISELEGQQAGRQATALAAAYFCLSFFLGLDCLLFLLLPLTHCPPFSSLFLSFLPFPRSSQERSAARSFRLLLDRFSSSLSLSLLFFLFSSQSLTGRLGSGIGAGKSTGKCRNNAWLCSVHFTSRLLPFGLKDYGRMGLYTKICVLSLIPPASLNRRRQSRCDRYKMIAP